ncbi:hypothetical protein BYT27DRAFT_7203607 [Phlegmacium glaucopus]|nr:hypothetical protein BYT27DRAFT_7203607 [Phlegmacium glaucopus]
MTSSRSTKDKTQRAQESFLSKLFDTFHRTDSGPSVPPKLPPKPSEPDYRRPDLSLLDQNVLGGFSKLSISGNPQSPTSSNMHFVGGFDPRNIFGSDTYTTGPSYARPMVMPVPHSLTMQMALEPVQDNNLSFCAQSNQLLPPPRPQINTNSISSSSKPDKLAISISTPTNPSKSEASSIQSTTSKKSGAQRCAGVTKVGQQCSRMVKTGNTLLLDSEDEDGSALLPRFCFQHTKEILGPSGYYARKNGEWVTFEDWIPPYLQAATQVSLRIEMEKARSHSDVPGYIYTFEIRETRESGTIKLKVGRAVNLVKRIDQWGKQCGSKEQVLRGFYPGVVEPDKYAGDGSTSLLKGRVVAGKKGPWCHRLERLIHLELADLADTCVYLDPSWPKVDTVSLTSSSAVEGKASTSKGPNVSLEPCIDCGSIHKEIFEFRRWKQGGNKGKEWDNLVKPVVERWGKFVELYV